MFWKKATSGLYYLLGIEDVYMEVVGKEMTWSISIPMSRDWKRDVIIGTFLLNLEMTCISIPMRRDWKRGVIWFTS